MSTLRILLLAPGSNPDSLSTSLVAYAHSEALARLHRVTLVTGFTDENAIDRARVHFHEIETLNLSWLYRFSGWCVRRIFKFNYGSHLLTAFHYPFQVVFECFAWRKFARSIRAGEFDVVLRLAPIVTVMPSPFSFFLRKGPIPFVIGPINGGLPWPKGFSQAKRERQLVTGLRDFYRFLPFARSTYRDCAAIVAGSSNTAHEFAAYRDKVFFVPENGLAASTFENAERIPPKDGKLELIYAGRLVPYKGCDLALRSVAPLLRRGWARFTILGDGPDRAALENLAASLEIAKDVSFLGWVSHAEALRCMRSADVLVFPSVREFGGGVVFEALASGAVPVVADFGGPGDIVTAHVGYTVPLTNEEDMVCRIQDILDGLARDRDLLARLRRQGMAYARDNFSWDAKAKAVTGVLQWAMGVGPRPNLPVPKGPERIPQAAQEIPAWSAPADLRRR